MFGVLKQLKLKGHQDNINNIICSPGYITRTILPTTLEASSGDPQDNSTHTTKVSFHQHYTVIIADIDKFFLIAVVAPKGSDTPTSIPNLN